MATEMDSETERLQNGNGSHQNNTTPVILKNMNAMNKDKDNANEQVSMMTKKKPLGERKKAVNRQKLMVFFGNTCVMAGGMIVSMPAVTLTQLEDPMGELKFSKEEGSWYASISSMASPLGGLLVSFLLDRVGRKNTILFTNLIGVLGWALMLTAPLYSDRQWIYIQILAGRFFLGVMLGLCVSPVGVYSAEISLPRIRGRLILGTSIGLATGILFMYVLGYFIRNDWYLISLISCVYQIFSTLCVIPMPESPSWLMQKGRMDHARKSLKFFRALSRKDTLTAHDEFETELTQIRKVTDLNRDTAADESLLKALKSPEVYKPLLLMLTFFFFQQFSGIVVVVVFAVQIAIRAGVNIDPVLCAVAVGVSRLVTTFFMSFILEKWGRKPAGLVSATGMTICMLLLAACGWWPQFGAQFKVLPVCCIVLHIVFSVIGLLTLPFFMISEVFPQRIRGSASGFTICSGMIFSFFNVKMFPSMEESMGTANLFAFYGFISLLAIPFIYFLVPETRGRTLWEIEEYFRTGRRFSLIGPLRHVPNLTEMRKQSELELKDELIKH